MKLRALMRSIPRSTLHFRHCPSRNSALSIRVQPTRCRRNSPVGITTPPTPARASPVRSAGASCPAAPAPVSARAHPRGSRPDYHQIIVKRNYESSRATAQPVSHRSDLRYPPRSTSQTTPSTHSRAPSRLRRSATLAAPCSTGTVSYTHLTLPTKRIV